jgi:hypothetical protein
MLATVVLSTAASLPPRIAAAESAGGEDTSVTSAGPPAEPRVTLESAWLVAADDGPGMRLVSVPPDGGADKGEQLVTGRFRFEGSTPAHGLRIVIQVPQGRHYVAGSATGPRAEIRYSVDGATFAGAAELSMPAAAKDGAGERRAALPEEYTHIRWELPGVFLPGTAGLVSFRVRSPGAAMMAGAEGAGEKK